MNNKSNKSSFLTFVATFVVEGEGDVGGGARVRGVILQFRFRQRRPRGRRPSKRILISSQQLDFKCCVNISINHFCNLAETQYSPIHWHVPLEHAATAEHLVEESEIVEA